MNQAYIHKRAPPKLVKDLKYGRQAQLSQSLLDLNQIENMNKIYIGRKDYYKIIHQSQNSFINSNNIPNCHNNNNNNSHSNLLNFVQKNQSHQQNQQSQAQPFVFLSPQQNLQQIKKQRISNKLKDKMNSMFKQKQTRKYKMRKPVIHNLLQDFKSSFRVIEEPKIKQALKNSQINLSHIKINNRKRVSSQFIRNNDDMNKTRPKFVSISTGKPVASYNYFPSFQDFLKGKYSKVQQKFIGIDINKIDNYVNTLITEVRSPHNNTNNLIPNSPHSNPINYKKSSTRILLDNQNRQSDSRVHNQQQNFDQCSIYNKTHSKVTFYKKNNKSRAQSVNNPNIIFTKSQSNSKNIIMQMKTYYDSKRLKTKQCDDIVGYLHNDRPLTSNIRRKNYTIIGKDNLEDLNKYRQDAEHQRVKILKKNNNFYINLLKLFQHCEVDKIPATLAILKKLKEFFESQYILMLEDVQILCKIQDKEDFGVKIIKDNLIQYAKKQHQLIENQQDQNYQIL